MLYFHSTATWSAKCGAFWEESPHSDYCYQFNSRLLSVCVCVMCYVHDMFMFMLYFHSTATWSAKCGAFWEESPHSDYCYQFNSRLLSVCLSVCVCVCVCYVHDMFMLCYIFVLQLRGVPNVVHSGRRAPTLTTATSSTPDCCLSVCVCVCYVHDMLYFHSTATWSAKCGAFWEESPHSDYCYQFNSRLLSVCLCVSVCVLRSCYVIFSFCSYVECQMWCILGGEPPL